MSKEILNGNMTTMRVFYTKAIQLFNSKYYIKTKKHVSIALRRKTSLQHHVTGIEILWLNILINTLH